MIYDSWFILIPKGTGYSRSRPSHAGLEVVMQIVDCYKARCSSPSSNVVGCNHAQYKIQVQDSKAAAWAPVAEARSSSININI